MLSVSEFCNLSLLYTLSARKCLKIGIFKEFGKDSVKGKWTATN